jgi:geranylgeranyl pyrophosphate synthase
MFALAAEAGAILGTKDEKAIDAMRHYGIQTGIAFQIIDDILDFVGKSEDIGKPVGNDLQQGLLTLPALYYIEDNPEDSDVASLRNGHNNDQAVYERIIQSISSSTAIDSSLAEARQYVESAKSALQKLPDCKYLDAMYTIADYVVKRRF